MKKVLIVTFLACLSTSLFASIKVRRAIEFSENSTHLEREALKVLDDFELYQNGFEAEKINIVSICRTGQQSFHQLKLSKERSESVLNHLSKLFEGDDIYEVSFAEGGNLLYTNELSTDCVIITAYFIESTAPKLKDPARELFPEEFGGERIENLPVAMTMNEAGAAESYSMSNIYFEGNSSVYKNKSEPAMVALLNFMENHPSIKIVLKGHVNGKMGHGYLKKAGKTNPEKTIYENAEHLSLARAETVKSFLVNGGIDEDRITCVGRGGKDMIFRNPKNERENAANRRIEVIILQ